MFGLKKFFISFALIVGIASCERIDMNEGLTTAEIESWPENVIPFTFDVSYNTVKHLLDGYYKDKEWATIEPVVVDNDTVMYLVDFEKNKGWAVLSADKRVYPILTEHDTGNLDVDRFNPTMSFWFSSMAERLSYIKKNYLGIQDPTGYYIWSNVERDAYLTPEKQAYYDKMYQRIPPEHYEFERDEKGMTRLSIKPEYISYYEDIYVYLVKRQIDFSYETVPGKTIYHSLLPTKWGQGSPWSDGQFPKVQNDEGSMVTPPAGCTAVAVGQTLYSLHNHIGKPNGLYHTVSYYGNIYDEDNHDVHFSRGNYVEDSPLWDEMPLDNESGTADQYRIVGDFLEDIGYRVGMKYAYDGSGATPTPEHFATWGITAEKEAFSSTKAMEQVKNGKVVLMTGYENKDETGVWPFKKTVYKDGHTWVADGYREEVVRYTRVYQWELVCLCPQEVGSDYYSPYYPCEGDPYYVEFPNDDPLDYCGRPCDESVQVGDPVTHEGWEIDWVCEHYPTQIETEYKDELNYTLTMNWGWDSSYDGAYLNFTPGAHNYQYKLEMIYNFR